VDAGLPTSLGPSSTWLGSAFGTRLGETLGIEWRQVDFETGVVRIEQQATSKRQIAEVKTATRVCRVEAPDWLLRMLAEIKLGSRFCGDGDLVFPTATGRPHSHGNILARGLYPALDNDAQPAPISGQFLTLARIGQSTLTLAEPTRR
jgi:integrase